MPKTSEEIAAAIKAQEELCEAKKYPFFAPRFGGCFRCGRDVWEIEDGTSLVTGVDVRPKP